MAYCRCLNLRLPGPHDVMCPLYDPGTVVESVTKPRSFSEHMRYLGCLGLLAECSVYVPEELREIIEQALTDAKKAIPGLRWRRILNRIEVEII